MTGFLGPNGAGKSTAMRMMVGLTRPDTGHVTISGRTFADLPNPGREVGVMLDASAQHAGRTGREILTLAQRTMGLPADRVPEMVHRVGLTETEAERRVGTYSLGMRQRLGVAVALIGAPSVLILDEPANGLDPAGIRWMRDLSARLRRRGRDRPAVVAPAARGRGHRRRHRDDRTWPDRLSGVQRTLLKGAGTVVRARDTDTLEQALRDSGLITTRTHDGALHADAEPTVVGLVAHESGLALTELCPADGGLEEMFLALTADTQREGKAA